MLHVLDFIIREMIDDLDFIIGEVIDDLPKPRFVCEVFNLFNFDIGKVVYNFHFYIWKIVYDLDFTEELTFVGKVIGVCFRT